MGEFPLSFCMVHKLNQAHILWRGHEHFSFANDLDVGILLDSILRCRPNP